MYGFIEKTSDLKEENAIYNEVVEAGKGWMHELLPGQSLRIVDMEGNQAVDTTFYDMTNPEDHYGAIPTIVMHQRQPLMHQLRPLKNPPQINHNTFPRHPMINTLLSQAYTVFHNFANP